MRTKTVGSISDFMNGRTPHKRATRTNKKKLAMTGAVGVVAGTVALKEKVAYSKTLAVPANATVEVWNPIGDLARDKATEALMPLVDMMQALAYPVAMIAMTGAAILYMINQKDMAVSIVQRSAIGYVGVFLIPVLMNILVGITDTLT